MGPGRLLGLSIRTKLSQLFYCRIRATFLTLPKRIQFPGNFFSDLYFSKKLGEFMDGIMSNFTQTSCLGTSLLSASSITSILKS